MESKMIHPSQHISVSDRGEIERFTEDLNKQEPLQVVITSHIRLEAWIAKLIEINLPNPKDFNWDMGFMDKLDLAIAMNLVPRGLRPACKQFNKIRNNLAHALNKPVSFEEARNLWNAIPKEIRTGIGSSSAKPLDVMRDCVVSLWRMFRFLYKDRLSKSEIKNLGNLF